MAETQFRPDNGESQTTSETLVAILAELRQMNALLQQAAPLLNSPVVKGAQRWSALTQRMVPHG